MPIPDTHVWRFHRSGGFDQVRIDCGEDLRQLSELDPKLWATLSCPTRGLCFDAITLAYLDSDHDGRIRVPEVLAAASFVVQALRDPDLLFNTDQLPLSALNSDHPTGARLLESAEKLRHMLGLADEVNLRLEHTLDRARLFPPDHANGDGIVPVNMVNDAELEQLIRLMMALQGQVEDRSGEPGIQAEILQAFFDRVRDTSAWWTTKPLHEGVDMDLAWSIFDRVRDKVDDYFARCRLAAFDTRAAVLLNSQEASFTHLATETLSVDVTEAADLPLAHVHAKSELSLDQGLNPAWQQAMYDLEQQVLLPLLGSRRQVNFSDWIYVRNIMQRHADWLSQKPQLFLDLPKEQLDGWLQSGAESRLQELLAADLAVQAAADAIMEVDKLLHYQRYLVSFLYNFVSLRDFYGRRDLAVFQAGRLYLDSRSCDLCVEVQNLAQHANLAGLSHTYLIYCQISRAGETDKTIVAAVTAGDAGDIMVGRHAIFYDRQGRDWDAKVIRLIENPISVREAFWTPYRRLGRMFSDQIQKIARAREQSVEQSATKSLENATKSLPTTAAAPAAAFDVGRFAGIFAAIGLALGAIGTALASVLTGFLALHIWQMPMAFFGVLALISGPSMIMAWFKLHSRNLGPILEGNGWAINTRARINIAFGTSLTQLAQLPPGAERSLIDPYAEKRQPWIIYAGVVLLIVLVLIGWYVHKSG